MGGPTRTALLKDMLERLTAASATTVILSFNTRFTVEKVLRQPTVDFAPHVSEVVGCEDYAGAGGAGTGAARRPCKSAEIKARWLPRASRLLFVDDDPSNIRDVQDNCGQAVDCICVRGGKGMTQADCDAVLEWARQRCGG